jgi:ATP-dependent NAD(P)H-hydrate dehydratase
VEGYEQCILTPNVVELGRLCKAKGVEVDILGKDEEERQKMKVSELARSFGGVTIIAKGGVDVISNGSHTLVSSGEGGLKRSGGQGDTLTGVLGTMLAWRKAYLDGLWSHDGDVHAKEALALVAYAGSAITRECSRLAFKERGSSLQAVDLTEKVHEAFLTVVGEPSSSKL